MAKSHECLRVLQTEQPAAPLDSMDSKEPAWKEVVGVVKRASSRSSPEPIEFHTKCTRGAQRYCIDFGSSGKLYGCKESSQIVENSRRSYDT